MGAGRKRLLVSGAVASCLLAIGAGVAIGRATTTEPDLVVVEGATAQATPAASAVPDGLPEQTEANLGTVVLRPADGLSDSPATASGFRLSRAGVDPAGFAGILAKELGVDGAVTQTSSGWQVGAGPLVTVTDDDSISWSYSGPASGTKRTASSAPMTADGARDVASALLAGIGVSTDAVEWQVDRTPDSWTVTAWQVVDTGLTSLSWTVDVLEDGTVRSASGFAGGLEEMTGYPVVGAATAVRRTSLPSWAAIPPVMLSPATNARSQSSVEMPPDRPALVVPVSNLQIVDARLALAQYRQTQGQLLILPSYVLTADDGSIWSTIAVSPDYVDFVSSTAPPSPAGTN